MQKLVPFYGMAPKFPKSKMNPIKIFRAGLRRNLFKDLSSLADYVANAEACAILWYGITVFQKSK